MYMIFIGMSSIRYTLLQQSSMKFCCLVNKSNPRVVVVEVVGRLPQNLFWIRIYHIYIIDIFYLWIKDLHYLNFIVLSLLVDATSIVSKPCKCLFVSLSMYVLYIYLFIYYSTILQDKYIHKSKSSTSISRWLWVWIWCAILWWMGMVTIFILCTFPNSCCWHWRRSWCSFLLHFAWFCCSFCEKNPWKKGSRWWWLLMTFKSLDGNVGFILCIHTFKL